MARVTLTFQTSLTTQPEVDEIAWLWVLRIYASGRVILCQDHASTPPTHLLPIIEKYVEEENDEEARPKSLHLYQDIIFRELKALEQKRPQLSGLIANNLHLIAQTFNLNEVEREILALRAVFRLHKALEFTLEECISEYWTEHLTHQILSIALARPIEDIAEALSINSGLIKSGLISFNKHLRISFSYKLTTMESLVSNISSPASDIRELMRHALIASPPPSLELINFEHQKEDISLVLGYLNHAKKSKSVGVNILFYGCPGVGKTELGRLIAKQINYSAFEVEASATAEETREDDDQMHERLRKYRCMQNLLSQMQDSLVIFDEIEDVFPRAGLLDRLSSGRKAWLNNLLESNPVPTIWISNHVEQIDPALMRRFDFVLEIKNIPFSKRMLQIQTSMNSFNPNQEWVQKVAENPNLTPAVTQKVMKVIQQAGIQGSSAIQMHFDKQISERDAALGQQHQSQYPKPKQFDISLLNTNFDINTLVNKASTLTSARVLLYGPPGTGKTALAHYLAEVADKPILQKRSSDLISSLHGETEFNLKRMFQEAYDTSSILFLDEADSFLQSRELSRYQWEISQVNELLTQAESFRGILVCATNFMQQLDHAALRRFQFKIKFEYMTAEQVIKQFSWLVNLLHNQTYPKLGNYVLNTLNQLKNLTMADFQIVLDQCQMLDLTPSVDDLIKELKGLSTMKSDNPRNIGFMH